MNLRNKLSGWACLLGVAFTLALPVFGHAYTGGPVRASIAGYDPVEQKIFYLIHYNDESGRPRQVWYFDLAAADPSQPVRAESLELAHAGEAYDNTDLSPAWRERSSGLQPLISRRNFDIHLSVHADSVGVDSTWQVVRYRATVAVTLGDRSKKLELTTYDDTMLALRGAYEIPGRPDVVVILTYRGKAYGSEEVELPLLISAK